MASSGLNPNINLRPDETIREKCRGLLEAIERMTETLDMTIGSRVAYRWVHVDLMQVTMKKSILHIKLSHSPPTNRDHCNKSMNDGHVSNEMKG
jgi:thiosulfate reductase cytochrome b subunit